MSPETILQTIRSVADCTTEIVRYLQTEEGKKLVNKSLEDRAAWDMFWKDVESGMKKLFSGELFKNAPPT